MTDREIFRAWLKKRGKKYDRDWTYWNGNGSSFHIYGNGDGVTVDFDENDEFEDIYH